MQRLSLVIAAAVLAVGLSTLSAQTTTPADRFFASAQHKEIVDGDLKGAIADYKLVVKGAGANRALAAQALLHMATCYEKLGDPQAQKVYEEIASNYSDQKDAATAARAKLPAGPTGPEDRFKPRMLDKELNQGSPGQISPDGKTLAFWRLTEGGPATRFALIIRDLDSGYERTLAEGIRGFDGRPNPQIKWASDGQLIGGAVWVMTGDKVRFDLVLAHTSPGGGQPMIVPSFESPQNDFVTFYGQNWMDRQLVWSPDHTLMPYLTPSTTPRMFDVQLLNIVTGASRPIGIRVEGRPDFVWSPTGDELAMHVVDATTDTDELRVFTPATSRSRALAMTPKGARARLGQWVGKDQIELRRSNPATPSQDIVSLISALTGRLTNICAGTVGGLWEKSDRNPFSVSSRANGNPDDLCLGFTPDGMSEMVWRSSSQRLSVHDIATDTDRSLTRGSGEEHSGFLSPDGKVEVFVSNREGNAKWGLYAAPLSQAPVANPVLISRVESLPIVMSVSWINDGFVARIAYTESNIWRLDMDPATGRPTGALERLTQDTVQNYSPSVSPDSRRVAYYSRQGARIGLSTMDANGANERMVAEQPMGQFGPFAWRSPAEFMYAGSGRVRVVDISTGHVEVTSMAELPQVANWSLIGATNEVVYLDKGDRAGTCMFRARSLSSGATRVVAMLDVDQEDVGAFLASPDGRRIAYGAARGTKREFGVLTASGEKKVLAMGNINKLGAWSADGRFLLYGLNGPKVADTTTGESWPLTGSTLAGSWYAASWAPDGSFLVLDIEPAPRNEYRQWRGVTYEALGKLTGSAMKGGVR